MVAPAGVSEGTPQEPSKAGAAAEVVPADVVPAQALPAQAVPTEVVPAQAGAVDEAPAAGTVEGEPTEATAQAKAEPAEAETEPADTETAEAPGPGWDAEEQGRDISLLAVVGIIVGIIALVGVAIGVLAVVTHGFRPKTVVTYRYRPAAVFGLRPGECVNTAANGLSATVRSCAAPHDAEVFATFTLPSGAWPGAAAVQQDAGNGCASRLGSYLNPQLATADLTQAYVYPNRAAWQAGERTVVCEVSAVSGKLTGSVRAKG